MTRLVSQKIQPKTRFVNALIVNALSASLIAVGAVLTSPNAVAAPATQLPETTASVAGAQPSSAIATPEHGLVARSQPRPQKETVVTRPNTRGVATITIELSTPPAPAAKKSEGNSAAQAKAKALASARAARAAEVKAAEARAAEEKAKKERQLLAQLEADLLKTEKRLDTTNQKLSAGQKELMSLNNTLQTVIAESGSDAAGLHPFVRVASRYAGTPYVWGGESRYGFDCSGFIIRVMRDLGYKALPHSAAEQFKYGQPVAQSLLKPGDIVFFANTYKPGISHVGIYIGKRRFIHAASTREGTIISSLDASPYKQKYAGARRLLRVKKSA